MIDTLNCSLNIVHWQLAAI